MSPESFAVKTNSQTKCPGALNPLNEDVWVGVVGPTGSGKSDLALTLAQRLNGEVVNCDALQVYQGLRIGTAKLSPHEQQGVEHHVVDFVSPSEEFSAAEFVQHSVAAVSRIRSKGRLPLIVGGTGLYLRSLRRGLFVGPGRSESMRARLKRLEARFGPGALYRLLKRWDPASAERIHPNDQVRVVRALEVRLVSGRPMTELMRERESPLKAFRSILLGLDPDKERLSQRIHSRVERMFAEGFVKEVEWLLATHGRNAPAFKAIGYREVLEAIDGRYDFNEAMTRCEHATRQYAKRQMTWFRQEEDIKWFAGCGDSERVTKAVLTYLNAELDKSQGSGEELANAETTSECTG